jgi:hypothetical protein
LGSANALGAGTQIILDGGTLDPGAFTNALSVLNISAAGGTIALGTTGSSTVSFADCRSQSWSGLLNITTSGLWIPTSIRFGTDSSALTAAQRGSIRVNGRRAWVQLDAQGYLWKMDGSLIRLL